MFKFFLGALALTISLAFSHAAVANTYTANKNALTQFDQTIGKYTVTKFRVNSKQNSTLKVTRLAHDKVHVKIVNRNYYYEKGDTFNNWVTLYNAAAEPIHAFYGQRGVGERRPTKGSRKGRTDFQATIPKDILDQVAYVRIYSDNDGNSGKVFKKVTKALEKGVLKGIEEFAKDTIKALLPSGDDLKKAILG